jgi:hypothetical protein
MTEKTLEEKQREYNIHLQCKIGTCHNLIKDAQDVSRVLAMRSGGRKAEDKREERRSWYALGETMAKLEIVLNTLDEMCKHLATQNEVLWQEIKEHKNQ